MWAIVRLKKQRAEEGKRVEGAAASTTDQGRGATDKDPRIVARTQRPKPTAQGRGLGAWVPRSPAESALASAPRCDLDRWWSEFSPGPGPLCTADSGKGTPDCGHVNTKGGAAVGRWGGHVGGAALCWHLFSAGEEKRNQEVPPIPSPKVDCFRPEIALVRGTPNPDWSAVGVPAGDETKAGLVPGGDRAVPHVLSAPRA